jgi:hypothetical protein
VADNILETETLIITRDDKMREDDAVAGGGGLRIGDSEGVNLNQ